MRPPRTGLGLGFLGTLIPLALAAGILCFASSAHAQARRINAIDVLENTKTNDDTVILIAGISVGDDFSDADLTTIENRLISSELFKDVNVQAIPEGDGVRVIINAKDKHSWVIAPTVYLQPGNKGGGFGFGENNLFGANKKLLLYGQVATADSMFIAGLLDPAIGGSRFFFRGDVFIRREIVTEYGPHGKDFGNESGVRDSTMWYLNGGILLGVNFMRGLSLDGRLRGAKVFYEDAELHSGVDPSEVFQVAGEPIKPPSSDGYDVSTEGKLTYDRRANYYGVTHGDMFQLAYEHSLTALGSDFDYWVGSARAIIARRILSEHNLVIKTKYAQGENLPFQQEFTAGGVDLRGFVNRQFRGDHQARATVEYSVPLFKAGSVAFRGLAFSDNAITWFDKYEQSKKVGDDATRNYVQWHGDNEPLDQLANGVGGGFRIYMRSIVMPLLGVDVGYGLQSGAVNVYFAVGLTEL